jgi:hypothetical protein
VTMDLSNWEWTCACCGEKRTGVPDLAFRAPSLMLWAADDPEVVPVDQSGEFCILEVRGQRVHYVRCVLLLPIRFAEGQSFGFGVWSTLSAENYERYLRSFGAEDQARLGPMFGYLGNRIEGYPDTLNLHLDVLPQNGLSRPLVRVQDRHAGHPLYVDQTEGLDEARLAEILSSAMPCKARA